MNLIDEYVFLCVDLENKMSRFGDNFFES